LALAGSIAGVPLVLAGCGSDEPAAPSSTDTDTSSSQSAAGGESDDATITIRDFAYGDPLTVAPGTEVTVVNEDSAPHNANDADGAWEFDLLQQDESTTFSAPDEAATYDLICTQHPDMSGQLIVEE